MWHSWSTTGRPRKTHSIYLRKSNNNILYYIKYKCTKLTMQLWVGGCEMLCNIVYCFWIKMRKTNYAVLRVFIKFCFWKHSLIDCGYPCDPDMPHHGLYADVTCDVTTSHICIWYCQYKQSILAHSAVLMYEFDDGIFIHQSVWFDPMSPIQNHHFCIFNQLSSHTSQTTVNRTFQAFHYGSNLICV